MANAINALAPYANARLLLFANQLPGVLDSPRTGRFLFEGFIKRLRQISSKDNSPGVDTGDFTYEGYLSRAAVLPLNATQPWDWLDAAIPWSTTGIRPTGPSIPALLAPCSGAALKPNRVVVVGSDESLTKLAERHGTTVATLRNLNPNLSQRPSDWLPVGSWLFIPRRRAAPIAADGTRPTSSSAPSSATPRRTSKPGWRSSWRTAASEAPVRRRRTDAVGRGREPATSQSLHMPLQLP